MGWGQSEGGAKGSGLRAAGTAALIMFCQTFLNKYRLKQLIIYCVCVCAFVYAYVLSACRSLRWPGEVSDPLGTEVKGAGN